MDRSTFIQRIDASLPKDGILLAGLRLLVTKLEPWTLNALLNAFVRRDAAIYIPGEREPKTPRWVSDFGVILCLLFATAGLSFPAPFKQLPTSVWLVALVLLCLVWPLLRLVERVIFVVGWIFVHDAPLHSIQRSLLSFVRDLFEVASSLVLWLFSSRQMRQLGVGRMSIKILS